MDSIKHTTEYLMHADKDKSVLREIYLISHTSKFKYWFAGMGIILLVLLFMPWTQNIRGRGKVTTLFQEQRPQELNSAIPGRVVKWNVKEGDMVEPGDTILELSEVKEDYLDPNILERTNEQINAKASSASNYSSKANAAQSQIEALRNTNDLKVREARNKINQLNASVRIEYAAWEASQTDAKIAAEQLSRNREMYQQGLISLTDLEAKQNKYQATLAKQTEAQLKYENAKQEVARMELELIRVQQEFAEKIAKSQSDRFQSLSEIATTQGEISKLRNQYSTYDERRKLYVVRAPQAGQITNARVSGIGEIIKEGEHLVTIVPDKLKYTVELFVKAMDVPLVKKGQRVSFLFDGFPAIVFSGWPNASYGVFSGRVLTIENNANEQGYYRVLVAEEENAKKPWPNELRIGTGAQGIALLNDVPIWYELWRNINGFPPDYYKSADKKNEKK